MISHKPYSISICGSSFRPIKEVDGTTKKYYLVGEVTIGGEKAAQGLFPEKLMMRLPLSVGEYEILNSGAPCDRGGRFECFGSLELKYIPPADSE
jgi:hypothetical protein